MVLTENKTGAIASPIPNTRLIEEDSYSCFFELNDVKCCVANTGVSHALSELVFVSTASLFAEE